MTHGILIPRYHKAHPDEKKLRAETNLSVFPIGLIQKNAESVMIIRRLAQKNLWLPIVRFLHPLIHPSTMGDLSLSQFEARIKFDSDADLSNWSGNTLRSGFGVHLRSLVCAQREELINRRPLGAKIFPLQRVCVYDYFYNSSPPEGVKVLRKQSDIPRPFVFDLPISGRHSAGSATDFRFTLIGLDVEYLPYFLLALRQFPYFI